MNNAPLIVIVGETASGKSSVAMELARQFNGEIVSADAWSVYKKFDIGTAKPSKAEQAEIPHHMIDIADAQAGYSAAMYKHAAQQAIRDISNRNKLPILVGGSGLYIDGVLFDYSFLPAPPPHERDRLQSLTIDQLIREATEKGYDLSEIDSRNKRRIIRLIENQGVAGTKQPMRPHTYVYGIERPLETLRARIEARVDTMLESGLEQEVAALAEEFGWDVEPMKGIGYREWQPYFEGAQNFEITRERIIAGTLRLAKKQRTWFRRNKSIQWQKEQSKIVALVTTKLNNYHR